MISFARDARRGGTTFSNYESQTHIGLNYINFFYGERSSILQYHGILLKIIQKNIHKCKKK